MDAKKAQKLVDQVADNVRQAIDEAQRLRSEAERIRGEAEAEASRRLDEVQSALADLRGRLSGEVEPGPVTVPEPEPPPPPEVPQTAEPAASANGDEAVAGDDDGAARLVAMKLALEGTPREAAKEQL